MKCSLREVDCKRNGGIAGAIIGAAMAAVLSLGLMPSPAFAVTSSEVMAEAQEVLAQIDAMQQTLDELSNQYFQALTEYQAAVESRDALQQHVDELTEEIATIQTRLNGRAVACWNCGAR